MTQRLQAKLQHNPQDIEGWRMLGWAYFNLERFADAANAYSRAIELRPDSAEYRSARGEALAREADGTVTVAAKKDFEDAVKLDPNDFSRWCPTPSSRCSGPRPPASPIPSTRYSSPIRSQKSWRLRAPRCWLRWDRCRGPTSG